MIEEKSEKKIVKEGNVVMWTTNTAKLENFSVMNEQWVQYCLFRAAFHLTEERHGWQPFRLSEAVSTVASF